MKIRPIKIAAAWGAVAVVKMNAAERLRLAERLIEDVQVQLSPICEPAMCVAEGMLRALQPGLEMAKEHVESWPNADLPVAT